MTDRIVPILAQSAKKHRDNNFIRLLEVPLETVLATAPHSYENDRSLNLLLRPYLEFLYVSFCLCNVLIINNFITGSCNIFYKI